MAALLSFAAALSRASSCQNDALRLDQRSCFWTAPSKLFVHRHLGYSVIKALFFSYRFPLRLPHLL